MLDGKEVYAFSPSTVTVVEGDTIPFTFINPEDDAHSFVMRDLSVPLPPQKVTSAIYVARHAGIFPFECSPRMQRSSNTDAATQIFGSKSKYSSSSFEPPSPLPSSFSDSMNSIRSIHLTILYPS
ncbi:hypothetical protein BH09GEM1_BH09GEM1_00340 [soil metagenome]